MKEGIFKICSFTIIVSLSGFITMHAEMKPPPLIGPGSNGYVEGELIYSPDKKPTPQAHASTIAETSSGLVAAWFGGTHENNPDVGIWVSHYENGEWTWPVEVADGSEGEDREYACWNPVLFQPRQGPLMLFYKVGVDPRSWWGMLMTSDDGGKTWSEPRRLGEHPRIGHLIGPVKNKPIQLDEGTIISGSSVEEKKGGETFWRIHFEISGDLGHTWEVIGPIHDGSEIDAIQPSILTHADGDMQILARTRQKFVAQSWSKDRGRTWSKLTRTHLPNPNAGTDAVDLHDGRKLLVYNHSVKTGRGENARNGRQILNVATSYDGLQWKPVITLEKDDDQAGYSYPAVIQTSDGMVHITYTYRRLSVKHVVIDPAKLP